MPLPHFLMLIIGVILAAGLTIWLVNAAGIPLLALGLVALLAAGLVHLTARKRHNS